QELKSRSKIVGDVRGKGLILGRRYGLKNIVLYELRTM
ncbi:unnamed protein product, partial [marine sediment metagenome]